MADPRDYIMQAGEGLQAGLSAYAAKTERDAELDKPLPDFLQNQLQQPPPTNPVSLGDVRAASPDVQPGSGGPMWANSQPAPDQWSPPDAASLGAAAPPPAQGSIADEHPEVTRVAHAYARGEMSIQDALAHAKKYTYRDMGAVDAYTKLRGQKTAEDQFKHDRETTDRMMKLQEKRNEGAAGVQTQKNEGAIDLQDTKSAAKWRELQAQLHAAALIAEHKNDTALAMADKRIKAAAQAGDHKMTQEMMGLKLELDSAAKDLGDSTKELEGLQSLVDEESKNRAVKRHEAALKRADSARKSLASYRAAMNSTPGAPPPGASPAPQSGPPIGDTGIQEPPESMNVPPPPTHSGRPDNALSPQHREQRLQRGAIPTGGGPAADAGQSARLPPVPTGRTKKKKDGTVWAEMSDGTAKQIR